MERQVDMRSGLMCPVKHWVGLGVLGMMAGCTAYESASDTLPFTSGNPLFGQAGASTQVGQGPMVPDLGADWSCLGAPIDRTPAPGTPGASVVYSLRLVDLASGEPFTTSTLRVCGLTDIGCNRPLMDQMRPDAEGWVNVPLTANFSGYLEIQSEGAVPYIYLLPDDGIRTMRDYPLVMIGLENFGALLSALRIQYDPTLGAIAVRTFDCQGVPAPGVVLQSSSGGTPFYFENGLPNTARDQTDPDGLGGFIGSVPGVTLFEAELSNGTTTSTKSMIIRPGWMTTGYMRPAQAVLQ